MSDAIISFPIFGDSFQLNPVRYFTLFGRYFYIYGIIIAAGFAFGLYYIYRKRKLYGLSEDNVFDILLCTVIGGILGARIYYVAFNFSEYSSNLVGIFEIWNGGLAVYGGIIGGLAALAIYCKVKKLNYLSVLDVCSFGMLIGQAIGRWGNFFNREAFGYETTLPWKMGLTVASTGKTIYVHPTFLYEFLWNVLGFILLSRFAKRGKRKYDGQIFLMYLAWYGLGRFMIEGLRTDSLYLFSTGIRISQLLGLLCFCAAGAFLIVKDRYKYSPENLYVNRLALATAAAGMEASGTVETAEAAGSAEEIEETKVAEEAEKTEEAEENNESVKTPEDTVNGAAEESGKNAGAKSPEAGHAEGPENSADEEKPQNL